MRRRVEETLEMIYFHDNSHLLTFYTYINVLPYLGWMDADMHGSPIHFLSLNALYVNNKLLSVDLNDFTHLLSLVMTSDNLLHKHTTQYSSFIHSCVYSVLFYFQ